jgi:predicted kinase
MNKQAFIYVGISASGKSTQAEKHAKELTNTEIINRDDIRRNILEGRLGRKLNAGELWEKWKFNKTNENKVTDIVNEKINKASLENKNIISSDTNLNKDRRNSLKHKLEQLGYVVEFKFFDVDFDKAVKWDLCRADSVGKDVIYEQYMRYHEDKKIVQEGSLPKAIICDLDGTLFHMNGRRGPFEWDKVDLDVVDEEIVTVLKAFIYKGYTIFFLSGRDGVCKELSYVSIKKAFYTELTHGDILDFKHFFYMRKEGDMRKDSIVKEELFNEHIKDKYNVKLVLDDRPSIVRNWHKLGFKVLQCGNAYIEF